MAAVINSHFCLPLPGKPGPYCPDGTRSRRIHRPKGAYGCMYYALQILRGEHRIGKDPRPEQIQDRLKEQKISTYRKKDTALDNGIRGKLTLIQQLFSDQLGGDLGQEHMQQFLLDVPIICEKFKENSQVVELFQLIAPFCEQKTFTSFSSYIMHNDLILQKRIELCQELFEAFNISLEEVRASIPKVMGKWEELGLLEQFNLMNTYAAYVCYTAYGCEYSSWKPDQPFSRLIEELRSHGPLMVTGRFGQPYYQMPPHLLQKTIEGRQVYGWSSTSRAKLQLRPIVHAIVIVGAEKIGEREYVYFLDPSDSSDPANVKTQKVYVMTHSRLCLSIATISGLTPEKEGEMSSWLAQLESEVERVKSFAVYLKQEASPTTSSVSF